MRCAIYIRVSGKRQIKGVSLEDQLRACREYALRQGWSIIEPLYVEPGRSAFTENLSTRVAFQQLLADARRKLFDVVLVYKLDRFARKVLIQYQAAAELERCRVQIASATEPIDRKTAAGRMTFGMLAVAAEAYSDQLSERMRDTRRAEVRQGRHVGPVPVGYVRGTDGKLQPATHAPDREAVQFGFQLYATGNESTRTVTIKLNEAGYTWPRPDGTRMPFHKDGVVEMLQNPVYLGHIQATGVTVEHTHEPLIDRAKLTTATTSLPFADLGIVAKLLGDLPELLKEATNEERRAVLVQLIDQVYLKHDAVLGIRPTLRAWPLMHAVYAQFFQSVERWAGWGSGLDPHTLVKTAPAVLRAA